VLCHFLCNSFTFSKFNFHVNPDLRGRAFGDCCNSFSSSYILPNNSIKAPEEMVCSRCQICLHIQHYASWQSGRNVYSIITRGATAKANSDTQTLKAKSEHPRFFCVFLN